MGDRRLHLDTSHRCNNRCVFCMEGCHRPSDYPAGCAEFLTVRAMRRRLAQLASSRPPILFTGGEPTINPHLLALVGAAKALGFSDICLQSNGRMLCDEGFCRELFEAGVGAFAVSIHGSQRRIHEALTRTAGSYRQSLRGLANVLKLKVRHPFLKVTTSTTVTRLNADDLGRLLDLLGGLPGIDVIVLNPLIPEGQAARHFRHLALSYTESLGHFRRWLARQGRCLPLGPHRLVWTDVPRCAMRGLEDYAGSFEDVILAELPARGLKVLPRKRHFRSCWGTACQGCARRASCTGISPLYIRYFGWSEIVPL